MTEHSHEMIEQPYEQLALFAMEPASEGVPARSYLAEKFAQVADDHAIVVDLIEMTMGLLDSGGPLSPEQRNQWDLLCIKLLDHNSPVVIFLIRVIADVVVASRANREAVLVKLRKTAANRLEQAELYLQEHGYET